MTDRFRALASERGYWLIVMFDLSKRSRKKRQEAKIFVQNLKNEGFVALHQSTSAKYVFTRKAAILCAERVRKFFSENGKFTILRMTDKDFSKGFRLLKGRETPMFSAPELISVV